MTWAALGVAIAVEVVATMSLKDAGRGSIAAVAVVVVGYVVAFALVAYVVQRLEVGVVYAVWSAVGTAAVVALGIVLQGDSLTWAKLVGVALIVIGVVVLHVTSVN